MAAFPALSIKAEPESPSSKEAIHKPEHFLIRDFTDFDITECANRGVVPPQLYNITFHSMVLRPNYNDFVKAV